MYNIDIKQKYSIFHYVVTACPGVVVAGMDRLSKGVVQGLSRSRTKMVYLYTTIR